MFSCLRKSKDCSAVLDIKNRISVTFYEKFGNFLFEAFSSVRKKRYICTSIK